MFASSVQVHGSHATANITLVAGPDPHATMDVRGGVPGSVAARRIVQTRLPASGTFLVRDTAPNDLSEPPLEEQGGTKRKNALNVLRQGPKKRKLRKVHNTLPCHRCGRNISLRGSARTEHERHCRKGNRRSGDGRKSNRGSGQRNSYTMAFKWKACARNVFKQVGEHAHSVCTCDTV